MNAEEVHELADRELEACIARIQKRIGVKDGDFGGVYFTGKNQTEYNRAVGMIADYIAAENNFNREDD